MAKKQFRVTAKGTEYLAERLIEADDWREAVERYSEMWEKGQIEVCDYELEPEAEEVQSDAES
jgi:DNA-binding PadR family transcriptional regulator